MGFLGLWSRRGLVKLFKPIQRPRGVLARGGPLEFDLSLRQPGLPKRSATDPQHSDQDEFLTEAEMQIRERLSNQKMGLARNTNWQRVWSLPPPF